MNKDEAYKMLDDVYKSINENLEKANFYNSNIIFDDFYLKDLLLAGAVTNSHLLLTANSGEAKTHLAKIIMSSLFANKYTNMTITPGIKEEDVLDVDFGEMKKGGKLSDAKKKTKVFDDYGIIFNELNRAPEIIQNMFITMLERSYTNKQMNLDMGVKSGKDNYQFDIITINEGDDYTGVSSIDKAVRNRVVAEIPLDYYLPNDGDLENIILNKKSASISVSNESDHAEQILKLYEFTKCIELSPQVVGYIKFLKHLDNCIKIPSVSKKVVEMNALDCSGCHHVSTSKEVCRNVKAPSTRTIINLENYAKGLALLRAYKNHDNEVICELNDVINAAPYVLYTNNLLSPEWINKQFNGDKLAALDFLVKTVKSNVINFYKNPKVQSFYEHAGSDEILWRAFNELTPWCLCVNDAKRLRDKYDNYEVKK